MFDHEELYSEKKDFLFFTILRRIIDSKHELEYIFALLN